MKWRPPSSLGELTLIIFNMELTHLGLDASNVLMICNIPFFLEYSLSENVKKCLRDILWMREQPQDQINDESQHSDCLERRSWRNKGFFFIFLILFILIKLI